MSIRLSADRLWLQVSELLRLPALTWNLATRQSILELEGHEPESAPGLLRPNDTSVSAMVEHIGKKLNFSSLKYQTIHDMVEAIGIGKENICTYCWNGKE